MRVQNVRAPLRSAPQASPVSPQLRIFGDGLPQRAFSLDDVSACIRRGLAARPARPAGPCGCSGMPNRSSSAWRAFSPLRSLNRSRSSTSRRRIVFERDRAAHVAKKLQVGDRVQPIGAARIAGHEDQFAVRRARRAPLQKVLDLGRLIRSRRRGRNRCRDRSADTRSCPGRRRRRRSSFSGAKTSRTSVYFL